MLARSTRAAGLTPRRVHATFVVPRRLGMRQPGAAVFVGPGGLLSNPFQRDGISQARSVILFRAWLSGEATPGVLRCAHFSEAEIVALERRRRSVLAQLTTLRGHDVRCTCAPQAAWCHGDVVLRLANERAS